jgi:hypothetical protein
MSEITFAEHVSPEQVRALEAIMDAQFYAEHNLQIAPTTTTEGAK